MQNEAMRFAENRITLLVGRGAKLPDARATVVKEMSDAIRDIGTIFPEEKECLCDRCGGYAFRMDSGGIFCRPCDDPDYDQDIEEALASDLDGTTPKKKEFVCTTPGCGCGKGSPPDETPGAESVDDRYVFTPIDIGPVWQGGNCEGCEEEMHVAYFDGKWLCMDCAGRETE